MTRFILILMTMAIAQLSYADFNVSDFVSKMNSHMRSEIMRHQIRENPCLHKINELLDERQIPVTILSAAPVARIYGRGIVPADKSTFEYKRLGQRNYRFLIEGRERTSAVEMHLFIDRSESGSSPFQNQILGVDILTVQPYGEVGRDYNLKFSVKVNETIDSSGNKVCSFQISRDDFVPLKYRDEAPVPSNYCKKKF